MARRMSSLHLAWRTLEGWGSSDSPLEHLDFIVDERSLGDALEATDRVGCLGWGTNADYEATLVDELLLEKPSQLETRRRLLYVCPACGDVGCGAITADVYREHDCFVWRAFGFELNYHLDDAESLFNLTGYENIGPFYFDATQYRDALTDRPQKSRK